MSQKREHCCHKTVIEQCGDCPYRETPLISPTLVGMVLKQEPPPIDMVLHCPNCNTQHIDEPHETATIRGGELCIDQWANPPHRSHECQACHHIWRPCDTATNGVKSVLTRGKADHPIVSPRVFL